METHVVNSAHAKLQRLCAESAARNGVLTTFAAVATAVNLSSSRLSQLFGVSSSSAEGGISVVTLGKIVCAFRTEGIDISVEEFYLNYTEFATRLDSANRGQIRAENKEADDETTAPYSSNWDIDRAEAYTDLAAVYVHPPKSLNSRSDCYVVEVSVRFEVAEYELLGEAFEVGLRRANLTFGSQAYQIAHNTLIGERLSS